MAFRDFPSPNDSRYYLRVDATEENIQVAANTSDVRVKAYVFKSSGYGINTGNANATANFGIDGGWFGGEFVWSPYDFAGNSGKQIFEGVRTIAHNSDGTKQVTINGYANDPNYLGLMDAGTTLQLTLSTIPRATQPTVSPNPVDAGSAVMIALLRASSMFTHDVTYAFGSSSGTIATDAGVSASWTPPMSLLSEIPNALSGVVTITVVTKNGTTVIGTKTTTLTLAVPTSVTPDFDTVTHAETVSAIDSAIGGYVQGRSKLALALTGAVGIYGSSIVGYRLEVASQVILAATGTTSEITATGTVTIVGTVTDSRGRTKSKTVDITVLAYGPPAITTVQVRRADAGGTVDPEGIYIRVDIAAAVQSLIVGTQKNALEYRISMKLRSTPTWTAGPWVAPGGVGFTSFALAAATVPDNESRDVRVEVRDALGTISTVQGVVGPTSAQLDLPDDYDAIAAGQRYDAAVGGSIQAAAEIYQHGNRLLVDVSDIATDALRGIVKLATLAQALAGVDSESAVTPEGLSAAITASVAGLRTELAPIATLRLPVPMVQAWRPRGAAAWEGRGDPAVPFWVTKSSSGVVSLEGLGSGVTVTAGTVIGVLPVGYRPATEERYPVMVGGSRGSMTVRTNGEIVADTAIAATNTYVSLSNILFLEASVANGLTWTTPTLLNSFAAVSGFTPKWAVDSLGDVWLRGRVTRATAWADGTAIFNIPAPYRASQQQHHAAHSSSGYGFVGVASSGDITGKHNGTTNDGTLSLAGVVYSPSSLDSLYSLIGSDYTQPYGDIVHQNSWGSVGSGNRVAGIRKRSDGLVMVRGLVNAGSIGYPIFWIPRALWPVPGGIMREAPSNGAAGRLDVRTNNGGETTVLSGPYAAIGSNVWFSLDGACWQGA